jgi:NAD(P)H-dependent FMN reductase
MSKTLLLSAGSTETSGNKKAAQYAMRYLQDRKIKTYLFDNLYTDIPFILEGGLVQPNKIVEIRNILIDCDQIIIFSPVFNGGYASHLKNTLDWLSLAFNEYKYNELFKNKKAAIVSAVLGKGGNSYNAYTSLSGQLENYGLRVFKEFYLFSSENNIDKKLEESTQLHEFNTFLENYLGS